MIVFEERIWEGQYWSRDGEQGVETIAYQSKIKLINGESLTDLVSDTDLHKAGLPRFNKQHDAVFFQASASCGRHIYRLDLESRTLTNMTIQHFPTGDCFGYNLSHSRDKMLFLYKNSGRIHSVLMNTDGSSAEIIAPQLNHYYMASLSHDNNLVVFTRAENNYSLAVKNLKTGAFQSVAANCSSCFVPQFSLDDKHVMFLQRGGNIISTSIDNNSDPLRLLAETNYDTFYLSSKDQHGSTDGFAVSPNGLKIAYIAVVDSVPQLFIMDYDGKNKIQLVTNRIPCARPSFSDSGEMVRYLSLDEPHGTFQLFEANLEGTLIKQITSVAGTVYTHDS